MSQTGERTTAHIAGALYLAHLYGSLYRTKGKKPFFFLFFWFLRCEIAGKAAIIAVVIIGDTALAVIV